MNISIDAMVIYELYVDKFAGNFKGLTRKLPYLSDLGINTLLILPHYPSPMIDGGYDVSNYKAVRFELGDLEEFDECMAECEKRNIRVIVDLVLNHVSVKHPWFIDAKSSRQSSKRDWFLWSTDRSKFKESKNAFPHLKPSNWTYSSPTESYYFSTFYPQQPDLNWDNPKVFDAFIDIMQFWIGKGVSGFRLDALSHMLKREDSKSVNEPEVHNIIKNLRSWIDEYSPGVVLLAEASGSHKDASLYFGKGDECHLVLNFGVAAALFSKYIMGDDEMFKAYKNNISQVPQGCKWAVFIRNHDALSFKPLPEGDRKEIIHRIDPHKDFSFIHDESVSMRVGSILDSEKIKEMYADLCSLDAAKVIYYGSEIGMKNEVFYTHPTDTREFVRNSFDWELAENQRNNPDSLLSSIKQTLLKK